MKSAIRLVLPCLTLLAIQPIAAHSQPTSKTSYSYYAVSGKSLREIRNAMVRGGPSANGAKAYGVTSLMPGGKMSVASCRKSGSYSLDLKFVIRLPKASNTTGLSSTEVAQLTKFVKFVKTHEETHRSMWMNYAVKYDRLLQNSRSQDCAATHAKAMTLWKQMLAAGRPDQIAFDQAERGPLEAHPFIKLAAR
jgi:predicted secreted Zn-dependent protease